MPFLNIFDIYLEQNITSTIKTSWRNSLPEIWIIIKKLKCKVHCSLIIPFSQKKRLESFLKTNYWRAPKDRGIGYKNFRIYYVKIISLKITKRSSRILIWNDKWPFFISTCDLVSVFRISALSTPFFWLMWKCHMIMFCWLAV